MNDEEIKNLHILQTKNVKILNQAKNNLIKDINSCLRKSDDFQVEIKTKLLALLYSAWSEAQFIQIVYTPLAFSASEIEVIKNEGKRNGISKGWEKMVELALSKVDDWQKSSDLHNRKQKLFQIIDEYIGKPASLRNKVAHGQWIYALNKYNSAESTDLSTDLANLDYVKIDQMFEVHKYLGLIIRDLVQSPKKTFHKDYWKHLTELEEHINKTKNWNIETKKAKLALKQI